MIDLPQFLDEFDESLDISLDDSDKYQAMIRLLCSTARRYNNIYRELECLQVFAGFNKPFPILRLPREIRDEIWTYALRAANPVCEMPRLPCTLATDNPFKPPTSGLLRVNKQVYHEAVEILYSKNVFEFQGPGQLCAFEQQIGLENCKRVRNMCVWIRFPMHNEEVLDPSKLTQLEYDSVPSHWIAALKACGLKQIVHLGIEAEMINSHPLPLLSMPMDLQKFIEEFLGRVADDKVPRLSLTGFREEEREKFPEKWVVVMDQWPDYKEEMEGLRRESKAYSDPQYNLDYGEFEEEEEMLVGVVSVFDS